MAELNPTFGKFNKFDILKGTSQSPLIFGNNEQPSGDSFGFDSSSNQSGVTVFFGNYINKNTETQLEVWLWDGSIWTKWTTINGQDANFGNLESKSVNFAWTMEGTTYSKMYFNAKNLDEGDTFKLRITGHIGNILIDDYRPDGVYDLEKKVAPKRTVSLDVENSNREEAKNSLESDISVEKDRALSKKISLSSELSLVNDATTSLESSISVVEASISSEISSVTSNRVSFSASLSNEADQMISEINEKDANFMLGDGSTWLDQKVSQQSYYTDAYNYVIAGGNSPSILSVEQSKLDYILLGANGGVDEFAELVSVMNQDDNNNDTAISSHLASASTELSTLESIVISMEVSLSEATTVVTGPVPTIFAENANTEHGYGVDNATITQTVGHWLTTPEYPTMDYNGGTFKNYKANETSRSSTAFQFFGPGSGEITLNTLRTGIQVTLSTSTSNFNVSQGEYLHISKYEANGLDRIYFDATLVSFTDNGDGTGTLVCTVTKVMNPGGSVEYFNDWHIVGGHTLGNGVLEWKNPNAVDWTAWEHNDFFWGANNNKAGYNYPLYNLLGSIWYNYVNYAPTIYWQRFFATIWEGGTEAEIYAAGEPLMNDGMSDSFSSKFNTTISAYDSLTYLKGGRNKSYYSLWAVGQVIQNLKSSNHSSLTELEVYDYVWLLRDFVQKVHSMAYSARNTMSEFKITNAYKGKLETPKNIWWNDSSGQTFKRIIGDFSNQSSQFNGYESPFPYITHHNEDADYDYNLQD